MNKQDFYFNLPEELIAQYPLPNRSDSRLLVYDRKTHEHKHHSFKSITDFLEPGDLLVLNNSKVIPARLFGQKMTGGKVELLVERIIDERKFLAHIKASKALQAGSIVLLEKGQQLEILGRDDDLFICQTQIPALELLHQAGHIPLPPYITRQDELMDVSRYQTVYAQDAGSVAAPTAGLHFDEEVLAKVQAKGVKIGYVTLHVGAGTFRPVRSEQITDHKMHKEFFTVDEALCQAVSETKAA
ncbi:MAG: tRNA preQ1(34) S-adenosylmethionine ribosyltransferase-isomerase QueA, partial [Legionella sp. 40-6]